MTIVKAGNRVEVNKREWVRNIYKYMKPGVYIVTKNDEPEYIVTVSEVDKVKEFEVYDDSGHDW